MTRIALGIAPHNGWSNFVTVAIRKGSPVILDRRRVELLDPGLPTQPYHHETVGMNSVEGEELVQRVRTSAIHCAEGALKQLLSKHAITAIGMRQPPLPQSPETIAEVHANYHIFSRADSMIYHDALHHAAQVLSIHVTLVPARTAHSLDAWIAEQRTVLGPPWQQDHKDATMRALIALELG